MKEITSEARRIIEDCLYEICDNTHSCCDDTCPVYRLNNHCVLNPFDKPFEENRGCDCFKSGSKMLDFIIDNSK